MVAASYKPHKPPAGCQQQVTPAAAAMHAALRWLLAAQAPAVPGCCWLHHSMMHADAAPQPRQSVGEDPLQALECHTLAALGALLGALDSLHDAVEAEHVPAHGDIHTDTRRKCITKSARHGNAASKGQGGLPGAHLLAAQVALLLLALQLRVVPPQGWPGCGREDPQLSPLPQDAASTDSNMHG